MRHRRAAAALALGVAALSLLAAAPVDGADPLPDVLVLQSAAPRFTQARLSNGLRVAVIENHDLPVVDVGIWYPYGSANEPARVAGTAHALEHMAFRGTHALSGTGFDELEAELGSDANAETDYEYTHFEQTLPKENLAVALHVEADRMRGLLLRERDWRIERDAVLEEVREDANNGLGIVEDAVRARAYAGTPFARDIGGDLAAVRRIRTSDLRRAYDDGYAPDGAALVVTGDVEPRAVIAQVQALFGPLRGRAHPRPAGPETPVHRGFRIRVAAPGDSTIVDVALEANGYLAPDYAVENLAAEVLNPDHGVLHDALVDEGPCNSYRFDDDTQSHGGLYHLACTLADGERPQAAVHAIEAALRSLADHPPVTLIENARRANIASTAYISGDLRREASMFGAVFNSAGIDVRELDRAIARVPVADVAAVFGRWATPVGVGITTPRSSASTHADDARPTIGNRLERPAPPAPDEPVARPAWARATARELVPPQTGDRIETFALPNGLRVYLRPRTDLGTLSMRAGCDFGARPAAEREGRLWWDAQLSLALGGETWSAARVDRTAQRRAMAFDLGSKTNAQGFGRDLTTMLDVLADAWRHPRISSQYSSRPHAVRTFLTRRLRPERAWIAFAGDVDAQTLRAAVTRAFATWQGTGPAPAPDTARRRSRFSELAARAPRNVHSNRSTVRVVLARSAPPRSARDYTAMTVVNSVLGEDSAFDTRLMREVRIRRGLAYFVASYYDPDTVDALLVGFESPPGAFRRARTVVRSVLSGMAAHPPSRAEIERARRKLVAAALRAQTTTDGVLDVLEAAARAHAAPVSAADVARSLDGVTAADVARVARTYLQPGAFVEFDDGPTR